MKNPTLKSALTHIFLTSAVALGVLVTASSAQNSLGIRTLTADVPFAFSDGSAKMPAGRYKVWQMAQHLLVLQTGDGSHTVYFPTTDVLNNSAQDRGKLIFHHYGDQYFLFQIWPTGATQGVQTLKGHAEQEILRAQKNQPLEVAEVPAVGSGNATQH